MMDTIYADPTHPTSLADCHFYHTMDLPGHGTVEGVWDLRGEFEAYTNAFDFAGKRVLDIGAGSGFLSFSAEQAGAAEIVSFDLDHSCRQDFLPFHHKLRYRDPEAHYAAHNAWIAQWHNAYWLAHAALGSRAKAHYGDVYQLPEGLGQFDVALVGSILEHLADPIKALASIARRTEGHMIIVTPMLETDRKVAEFMGDRANPDVDYVFWTNSRGVFDHVLAMLGFEIERASKREFLHRKAGRRSTRHVLTARRVAGGADAA